MSNKSQLQLNNSDLQSILSTVLGLPTQESCKTGQYVWKKYETKELNEVSYLQNSGTQSIDTGVNPNNNTRLLLDIEFLEIPSGISYVQGTGWYGLFYDPSGILEHFYYDKSWTGASISNSEILDRMTIDMSNTGLLTVTLSNGTKRTKQKTNSFTASIPSLPLNANVSKLYSYKIYDGNTLIRDFVPCKNANEEYGLFDKVNSKFYSNVGSGSYTGGNTTGNTLQTKGDYIGLVVSDNADAYPDIGIYDEFWYEKISDGVDLLSMFNCTKISIDKFTYATVTGGNIEIAHSLGEKPRFAIIYCEGNPKKNNSYSVVQNLMAVTDNTSDNRLYLIAWMLSYNGEFFGMSKDTVKSDMSQKIPSAGVYYAEGTEYTLITMA